MKDFAYWNWKWVRSYTIS